MVINPKNIEILIVDDLVENIQILSTILEKAGYNIRFSRQGSNALRSVQLKKPDLILLDIRMPVMNGYDVCRTLKANPETADIPIIFISALTQPEDKINAFAAGGVDYITKPFDTDEVAARINTHLTISHLQHQLVEQNKELDAYAHTVAHDLKNPLGIVNGYLELLEELLTDEDPPELSDIKAMLDKMVFNQHRAIEIIDDLLLLGSVRQGEVTTKKLDMTSLAAVAIEEMAESVACYQGYVEQGESLPPALGYGPWVKEVWQNYISNGLKYGGQTPYLQLGAEKQPNQQVKYWVKDNGPGIATEDQKRLFIEFSRLKKQNAPGSGLGLSIVKRIVKRLGGKVGVESKPGEGSLFYFTLPTAEPAHNNGRVAT